MSEVTCGQTFAAAVIPVPAWIILHERENPAHLSDGNRGYRTHELYFDQSRQMETAFAGYDGAVALVAIRGTWGSVQSVSLLNQSRKALQGLASDDAIQLVGDHAQLDQFVDSSVCQSLEGSTADTKGRTPGRWLQS